MKVRATVHIRKKEYLAEIYVVPDMTLSAFQRAVTDSYVGVAIRTNFPQHNMLEIEAFNAIIDSDAQLQAALEMTNAFEVTSSRVDINYHRYG